jgi:hypothetical protein
MKKLGVAAGVAGIAAAVVFGVIVASASGGKSKAPEGQAAAQDPVQKQLAEVKAATARFQRVEEAVAAGYEPDPICIASPAGGMGTHYIKFELMDNVLDIAEPEILLYARDGQGRLGLVAVEYFQPDADQNLATSNDKPSLFGQPFDGPMEGHAPGMPIHYDLHVWLWQNNPAGIFAQWNPNVTCPPAP